MLRLGYSRILAAISLHGKVDSHFRNWVAFVFTKAEKSVNMM